MGLARQLDHALKHGLKHRQTGSDPKLNGYAYIEVPEWQARQWLEAVIALAARPTADLGEERKRALDELRVAAQICEIDENPIVREQALRIRAARDVLSRSA